LHEQSPFTALSVAIVQSLHPMSPSQSSFSSLLFLNFSSFCFYSSPIPPQVAIPFYPSPHAQFILILLFLSPIPPQFASTQSPLLFNLLSFQSSFPHFATNQAPLILNLLFLPILLLKPVSPLFILCLSTVSTTLAIGCPLVTMTPAIYFYSSPIPPQFALPSYPAPQAQFLLPFLLLLKPNSSLL
jgi:hypothetical protein